MMFLNCQVSPHPKNPHTPENAFMCICFFGKAHFLPASFQTHLLSSGISLLEFTTLRCNSMRFFWSGRYRSDAQSGEVGVGKFHGWEIQRKGPGGFVKEVTGAKGPKKSCFLLFPRDPITF